jgi:tetratricopeptide (TPR) repeat protein
MDGRECRRGAVRLVLVSVLLGLGVSAVRTADVTEQRFAALERAVAANPEDLAIAADYRRLAIEAQQFDRSIDFLEKLAKGKGSGPNVQISLALADIDKVPVAGDLRRLSLGRDAIAALTRSIAQRPTVLAYYIRGQVNLYFNRRIFNRTAKGVADLTQALAMAPPDTPGVLMVRIYTALGDGYYKLDEPAKAHDVWSTGALKFPDDAGLKQRLETQGQELEWLVGRALAAERRVDTSLAGALPVR